MHKNISGHPIQILHSLKKWQFSPNPFWPSNSKIAIGNNTMYLLHK